MNLDETRVAVLGDVHGNVGWTRRALTAIAQVASDVKTVIQLGDFWPHRELLQVVDEVCAATSLERVIVTLGNHEPWGGIDVLMDRTDAGDPVQLSGSVTILRRPHRLTIGTRVVLSLGGAASVDREWRTPGFEWWPDELITDAMVEDAIAGGPADIMLTHETPDRTPVTSVQRVLAGNPLGFPKSALEESAASRRQIDRVWDAIRPRLLIHGHMHVEGAGITHDGRRVVSLNCDGGPGNAAILDLRTLDVENIVI